MSNQIHGRCQVTSDGFRPYNEAVEEAWGADVDLARLVKIYGAPESTGPFWYGPGSKVIETVPTPGETPISNTFRQATPSAPT
ncbi:MAG: hypothetical protein ACLQVM_01690 [Terriglobia bacterium]